MQTAPLSMPTLASSAAGFTMAGSGKSAGLVGLGQRECRDREPAAESRVLATCFRWQTVMGQARHPVNGVAGQLQGADHEVLEAGVAVHPLAEVEDQVGPADPVEPAEVAQADRQQVDLVAPAAQAARTSCTLPTTAATSCGLHSSLPASYRIATLIRLPPPGVNAR